MSHFKVLVLGDNIEEQLAPYDENLTLDPYQDPDYNHQESLVAARRFYTENPELRPGLDLKNDKDVLTAFHEGEDIRFNEDGTSTLWTTYNPKSKWDYWVVGGRYNASLMIRPDADLDDYAASQPHWTEEYGNKKDHRDSSDQARKRAVDFEAMAARARARAESDWAEYEAATRGLTPPATGWAEHREKAGDIDTARESWNANPWIRAVRQIGYWDADPDQFFLTAEDPRGAFIANAELMSRTGYYAVVKDGEWIARGDMGWFGMSDDKVDETTWRGWVAGLIDQADDDTLMTTVDCHI